MNKLFFIPVLLTLLISCNKKADLPDNPASPETYVHYYLDSTPYSCENSRLVFDFTNTSLPHDSCGDIAVMYSSTYTTCFPSLNMGFILNIAVPHEAALMPNCIQLHKKFEVKHDSVQRTFLCPLNMTIEIDSGNTMVALLPDYNPDTNQQYVIYTNFESGEISGSGTNKTTSFYLTGNFKCMVSNYISGTGQNPRPLTGNFRVKVLCDR